MRLQDHFQTYSLHPQQPITPLMPQPESSLQGDDRDARTTNNRMVKDGTFPDGRRFAMVRWHSSSRCRRLAKTSELQFGDRWQQ